MQTSSLQDTAALIITYNPNIERLKENLEAVMSQVAFTLIVDNASGNAENIRLLADSLGAFLLPQKENRGIATALNCGMEFLKEKGFSWVLTLDQDSVVSDCLVSELHKCAMSNDKCGISCPEIIYEGWSSKPKTYESAYEEISACMTSASLTSVDAWEKSGKFEDNYFIDHVDNEFCMKLRLAGYAIIRNHIVSLSHMLGDSGELKIGFFRFKYSHHAPLRYYYMTRNNIVFVKKYRKFLNYPKELIKILYLIFNGAIVEHNKATIRFINRGIKDARRQKMGAYNDRQ